MARTRTTKKLAQRVDLNYFKRPTAFKRAKLWLSVGIPLVAIAWIAWHGLSRDSSVYSSGRMSEAHAVLERQCGACHVAKAGEFSSNAADSACLACHDGPMHHENEVASAVPTCATCHMEHRGLIDLRASSNQRCADCHGHLRVANGQLHFAANIHSFEDGHPEFATLREGATDPGTIRLNHAIHMKPIRRGPNERMVQLECGDCHRSARAIAPWLYADQTYVFAETSYSRGVKNAIAQDVLPEPKPLTGREKMAPVQFATACAGCHLLSFDKRFEQGVPHDTPEVVDTFLTKKFQEYIAAHPSEVRVAREPKRDLTGKPIPPEVQVLTPAQWVAERRADAEELLWRKTCKQCHTISFKEGSLPSIAPAQIRETWLPHAKFDHDAHRGFSCSSCHAMALTSTETSDSLVPGIANCKTCHAPGPEHAESRCFECHTYHDWAKRKEVKPTYVLPVLERGGK